MTDYQLTDTIYHKFTTRAFATGIPTTLAGTPVVSVYENDSVTQITAGITLTADFDSVTGLNHLTIVLTGANGFEANKNYQAVITTGTVGGVSVVGEVVLEFSIERSAALKIANNNSIDIATINGNVDAILVDTDNTIPGLITALNDLSAAQVNAEVDTALADIHLDHLLAVATGGEVVNDSLWANLVSSSATAAYADYDNTTDSLQALRDRGDAAWVTGAGGTPPDLLQSTTITGLSSQTVFNLTAGSADDDAYNDQTAIVTDSVTSEQRGVAAVSDYVGATKTVTLAAAMPFTIANGDTIDIIAAPAAGTPPSAATIADAVLDEVLSGHTTAGTLGKAVADIEADTNELQGDDVPGLIAGLNDVSTAEVNAQCDLAISDAGLATAASISALNDFNPATDAVATVTDVTNRVTANMDQIAGVAAAATGLSLSADAIESGTASGTPTGTTMVSDISITVDDQFNGRNIIFADDTTTAGLRGAGTDITACTAATNTLTFSALPATPVSGDTFIIV